VHHDDADGSDGLEGARGVEGAHATLDAGDRDTAVHLLLTAPQQLNTDPAERLSKADLGKRIATLHIKEYSRTKSDKTGKWTGFDVEFSRSRGSG
jgi:hypothetical protein